jgi:hypothetical protein
MEHQFDFIKNGELKNVFINAYKNDLTNTTDDDINVWAKNKIKKINDECLKKCENAFDEEMVLEEYNEMKNNLNNEPVTITNDFKNKINVPIVQFSQSAGKRKTRKSGRKSRKPRRKPRKTRKSMRKSKK